MRLDQKILLVALVAGRVVAADTLEVAPLGRLHLDYAHYDSDATHFDDRALVRRAQFGFEGKVGSDWSARAEYDFALSGSFKNAYLRYRGWGHTELTLGQFKVPFGLEQLTSPNDITFLERALPSDAFNLSRRLGIGLQINGSRYTWAARSFSSTIEGIGGKGAATRFTFTPIDKHDTLVHLGLAALTQRPKEAVKFGAQPEALPTDIKLVHTGTIAAAERMDQLGLEAAWKDGPVSIQGEWIQTRLSRTSSEPDVSFDGWYVAGSWVLTGESRGYKNGVFKGVVPAKKAGAWELAVRYSRLDLNNGLIEGGEEHNVTVGLNWYSNDHLRLMANFIIVNSDRQGIADSPKILDVRTQLAF